MKMKNFVVAFLTASVLIITACEKSAEPCFSFSPTNITAPATVTFDASCTKHRLTEFRWNFGDGSPDTILNTPVITHTYSSPGTYGVVLTVGGGGTYKWTETHIKQQ